MIITAYKDIAIIVEAIGSHYFKEQKPSVAENEFPSSNAHWKSKLETDEDQIEEIILKYARHESPPLVSADATDEETD
ncbi:hypothetical protein BYT27DRAFT_7264146 [Phlegmacium glaucopus]|nr:hypothetical protein BYT27DRAFT_7264146 [Phlegmacium glaucopus]